MLSLTQGGAADPTFPCGDLSFSFGLSQQILEDSVTQSTSSKSYFPQPATLVGWLLLCAVFLFAYASTIQQLVQVWYVQSDHYGHGFLVPLFSVWLLWLRRDMMDLNLTRGSWWGIPFLVVWALMRWTSSYFMYQTLDAPSMIPFFAGLTLLLGGWRALHWAWPSIVFLVFMMPLPGFLATQLSLPLQRLGSLISTFVIQTVGIPAVAEGNVIQLESGSLDVAAACSGLRMLMLFFAICVGAAFVLDCEIWKKIVIVASAIPIAIVANVMRLTLTAILYSAVSPEFGEKVGHDTAGWLMMPLALLILWGELSLLSLLFMKPVEKTQLSVSLATGMREGK